MRKLFLVFESPFYKKFPCILLIYFAVGMIAYAVRSFPALYGDELRSLNDSSDLFLNIHAIGYFIQLKLWRFMGDSDFWLRLLSYFWGLMTLWGCWWWGRKMNLSDETIFSWCALLATNAFFLQYAMQVRFYSFFLAMSVWACALGSTFFKNKFFAAISLAGLVTSHLFGWVVLGILMILFFVVRFPQSKKVILILSGLFALMVWITPIRMFGVSLIYQATSNTAIPEVIIRGLSFAMLVKIPMTFFFFLFGERVYPLWIWITLPGLGIMLVAFFKGFSQFKKMDFPYLLAISFFLSIIALYLILDPLAPPGLQGACPRYVIYALPIFLLIFSLNGSRIMRWVWFVQLASLICFLHPHWSYTQTDLMDWPEAFKRWIPHPINTCVLYDGRSQGVVHRYFPKGAKLANQIEDCKDSERIFLISNDFRVELDQYLDAIGNDLLKKYSIIHNETKFPAQITVYEKKNDKTKTELPVDRLSLHEQDLQFPLRTLQGEEVKGFKRLDAMASYTLTGQFPQNEMTLAANYYSSSSLPKGTPILSIQWIGEQGILQEKTLKAGDEICSWRDRQCTSAFPVASWQKKVHLVGKYSYPDAYRQYEAKIWGCKLEKLTTNPKMIIAKSLLQEGTVYLFNFSQKENL